MKRTVRRRLSKGLVDKFFLLTNEVQSGFYTASLYTPVLANRTEQVVEVTDFLPECLRSLCRKGKEFTNEKAAHEYFSAILTCKDNGFIPVFDCDYHVIIDFDDLDDIVRTGYIEWLRYGCCDGEYYGSLSAVERERAKDWLENKPNELIEQFKPDWELFTGYKKREFCFLTHALDTAFLNYCKNSI